MHESVQNALSIAREAKGLTQGLKESLKKHEPWDREIEFQRANLRRQYLQLIFVHPYSKESKDADHSLWLTTSYYIIAAYKQRIAAADAVAHQSASDNHGHGRAHHPQHNHQGKPSGVVEHRKLVHRFRQFLAEEEKFWTSLIVRIVRVFGLEDAQPALTILGITVSEPYGAEGSPTRSDRRNVFPIEAATVAPSQSQKEQKLIMLSKALVCLGDIARYREHYNEGGGRPRAGKDFHDESKASSRGRAGEEVPLSSRPGQGITARRRILAILASYQQDPFSSVLQYYRAMCVKLPYETAAANLDSTLSRNLESYRIALAKLEAGSTELIQSPKQRVERFKKSLVALHGLWRLEPAQAEIYLPGHALSVMDTFSALVSERVLPTDIIWKTLVIALGALWRCRILRDPNAKRDAKKGLAVEARIFAHILGIMRTLYQIGGVQLADASSSPEPSINGRALAAGEAQIDLAQSITAVFRRSLPTLRIASKWLIVHVSYFSEAGSRLGSETGVDISTLLSEFWASYSSFSTLLGKVFPIDKLPKMTLPLEEDVDVSGFAPLKQAMFNPTSCTANGLEPGQSQVHPNEEQLMRISDLLQDAIRISEFVDSPVELTAINSRSEPEVSAVVDNAAAIPSPKLDAAMTPLAFEKLAPDAEASEGGGSHDADVHSEVDDDNATVSTRTDDEIVNLAITANLPLDDDDEMEQVVYPKQTIASPAVASCASGSFATPSVHSKPLSPAKALTAEDLLNDMMRPRGSYAADPSLNRAPGSPLPPPLLFGSASPSAPPSIWSTTSHDSASLSASNLRITGYPGAQTRVSPPVMPTYTSALGPSAPVAPIAPVAPVAPSRIGFTHQRQLSQPLAYSLGTAATSLPQGPWSSQGSSHLSVSQSQSQQRHTLSPPLVPFALQPMGNTRTFGQVPPPPHSQPQQHHHAPFSGAYHPQLSHVPGLSPRLSPQQVYGQSASSSMHSDLPTQSTWSYSGEGSLTGRGAPLGPFAADLPYPQLRIQQQAQMQRSGAWAPS
ncbi:hypothetical protein JB92DRAFT_3135163 [Gautieria morchelliformis]|nr:hypothetical protein JB92DRAFT_3135163 [Gautieria morchelliformis]